MGKLTTETSTAGAERSARVQSKAGVSGNRKGRPRKAAAAPTTLAGLLTEVMKRPVAVTGTGGKKKMLPIDLLAQHLVQSNPAMKPRKAISLLQLLQRQGEFETEQQGRAPFELELTVDQARKRLKIRLEKLSGLSNLTPAKLTDR